MTRYFSGTTPQQAPLPRAAWQASASGAKTAPLTIQAHSPGSTHATRPTMSSVATAEPALSNRLRCIQRTGPPIRTGEGRGAIGLN
jgi:hypothetical protein